MKLFVRVLLSLPLSACWHKKKSLLCQNLICQSNFQSKAFLYLLVTAEKFTMVLLEQQQDRARREQERIRLYSADPFDLEAQAKIEEDIR